MNMYKRVNICGAKNYSTYIYSRPYIKHFNIEYDIFSIQGKKCKDY